MSYKRGAGIMLNELLQEVGALGALAMLVGLVAMDGSTEASSQVRAATLFGTVILERVIDTVTVIALAVVLVSVWGSGGEGLIADVARYLLPLAIIPAVGLLLLRTAPDRMIGWTMFVMRPLPLRFSSAVERLLRQFSAGLGSLRSGMHLFWIGVDSLLIWFVASTVPVLAGFWALGVNLGSPIETLVAAWTMLVAVALAVALPSAPGFFGPYHLAARMALEQFGIPAETAVAVGTLVHAVFWLTLTGLGLAVLWSGQTSLRDLDQAAIPPDEPQSL